jgi:ABC-2 type transport system ATP-binding protein
VARVLLADPPVLLLDEPLSGLDPGAGRQLREHLRALADSGRTIVVSTHELAHASEIGDDVILLRAGRIVGRGETSLLRAQLLGERKRIRVRGRGDVAGALDLLGHRTEGSQNGGVIVEVADEAALERLVAGLVAAGIGVREVAPAKSPLEDLYLALQPDASRGGAEDDGGEPGDAR